MRALILCVAMIVIVAADVDDGEVEFDFCAIGPTDVTIEEAMYVVRW